MAGGSFGTKVGEGAEARNKQTGLLLFLTKPESTNQATKSLLSHYILRRQCLKLSIRPQQSSCSNTKQQGPLEALLLLLCADIKNQERDSMGTTVITILGPISGHNSFFFLFGFQTRSYSFPQSGLKLLILLPQPPQ